ncbi:carbon storage regulator CsrA [Caldalkalibacillus salinus]|uniref:carbon storage regulator CsrA n=1 Tax=Caldalkalibacillus salinus TaxID=2803787 RepID=UPI001921D410|nr:carbon storage regulator CsrA [Caldalkalibacillus salinus]
MLVLSRKKGESIIIDEEIEIKVVAVEGDTIKLGVEAPKHISIHRKEVYLSIQEENRAAASQSSIELSELIELNNHTVPEKKNAHHAADDD